MKITIDGQSIDFTLEKEKTLEDIYRELEAWLARQGRSITTFSADGRELDRANQEEILGRSINDAALLELTSHSEKEMAYYELSVIQDYFTLLERALVEDPGAAVPILAEYPYVRAGLLRRLKDLLFPEGQEASPEDLLLQQLAKEKQIPDAPAAEGLAAFSRGIILAVTGRLREIAAPREEAAGLARLIREAKPALENVPLLLQTGKDQEAMQHILVYTELALKATRLLSLHLAPTREETETFCRDLNGALRELTEAFGNQDSVLIGDILEYEIAPRTEGLVELLRAIPGDEPES